MFKKSVLFVFIIFYGCIENQFTYQNQLDSFKNKTQIIELVSSDGIGRIAVAPKIQGKILFSTTQGLQGSPNGWINKTCFQGDTINMAAVGGEDRIWVGPLGGQYSFYYQQIKPLHEDHWKVPKSLSVEPYILIEHDDKKVVMQKKFQLTNFMGTKFNFTINRQIKLLEKDDIETNLNITLPKDLKHVAYESRHVLTNKDTIPWQKNTGLISLWSAGMFQGHDKNTVIIPLENKGALNNMYKYMGQLNHDRLRVTNHVVLFKADGKYRSKIGIPNLYAPSVYGCYSKSKNQLTIVQFKKTQDTLFSNSHATVQNNPYRGEVIPIYNNGPMDLSIAESNGFFELESTSSFKALLPSESLNHYHRIYHFSGNESVLNRLSTDLLGISLNQCF
ncbi:hypothetical protein KFZ70_14195 [Tamlana fucoidanivorans]|uniref:Lipoprotein n=1 Tax=Allotamlana fucoidanivorans TaxID=2583814 RepID=A0A5C4SQJ6_9FLAO|nr:DUF6786 family protein [Tamlana fucoidanivorans]TNJ46578.1 hypothetical protein FGF67_02805 [Tamlana fucoidanivorans]